MPRLVLALALAAAPSLARAEIVAVMTPELVQEAITAGQNGANGPLTLWSRARGDSRQCGKLYTPFSRVASAAMEAEREYRKLTPGDIAPDLLGPYVLVVAHATPGGTQIRDVRRVRAVVVSPVGSDGSAAAVHPDSRDVRAEPYGNALGAKVEGVTVAARFPLSIITEGNEVRVVYEDGPECRAPIRTDGLR